MKYQMMDSASKAWLRECDDELTLADRLAAYGAIGFVALFLFCIWVTA